MRFETLRELYLHSIDSFGPRPCFSMYGGESLTYAEFSERVNTLIDIFVHAGLNSGDKIALLSNNMPNWGVAYFAATVSGMVIVPILPDFSGPELDKIILHSEAKALVVSDKLFADDESLCQTVGRRLLRIFKSDTEITAVAEQTPERR